MKLTWRVLFRLLLIIIFIGSWGYFIASDVVATGQLTARYDMQQVNPYILPLSPGDRVSEMMKEDGRSFRRLSADPVYFDLRTPRSMRTATFSITYRGTPPSLAVFTDKAKWLFDLQPLSSITDLDNGWRQGTATFDLSVKPYAWQKYQLMVALADDTAVDIAAIDVIAHRPPLTWPLLIREIKERL